MSPRTPRPVTTDVPTAPREPVWIVAPDGRCHSVALARTDAGIDVDFDRARSLAHARVAALSLMPLGPPGVVGRGDHVYVEVHCKSSGEPAPPVTYVFNINGDVAAPPSRPIPEGEAT